MILQLITTSFFALTGTDSASGGLRSIQILLITVFICLLLVSITALMKKWLTRKVAIAWVLVSIAGAVAVLWPELTTKAANKVGIERGADLVLYGTVVVMMIGFLMGYVRLRRLRRELTLLVRQLALRNAHETPDTPDTPVTPGTPVTTDSRDSESHDHPTST